MYPWLGITVLQYETQCRIMSYILLYYYLYYVFVSHFGGLYMQAGSIWRSWSMTMYLILETIHM